MKTQKFTGKIEKEKNLVKQKIQTQQSSLLIKDYESVNF